jgi:hypothetical protein
MTLSAVRDRPGANVALNLHDGKTLIFAACVDTFAAVLETVVNKLVLHSNFHH